MEGTVTTSAADEAALKAHETARMEQVLQGPGYAGSQVFLSVLLMAGLVLVLVLTMAARPAVVGVGVGLMLAGVLGHAFEAVSMQRNRQHLAAVEAHEVARQE